MLAQQLGAPGDAGSMSSLAQSRAGSGNFPFFGIRSGAVGYMPVVITLSEGTMLSVTGVVSADRRYVRITPFPYFSAIGEVNTFNFVTGEGGTTAGGTGGQGFAGAGGGAGTGGAF